MLWYVACWFEHYGLDVAVLRFRCVCLSQDLTFIRDAQTVYIILINYIIETDDGRKEHQSPWPQYMQQEVWAERVRLRRILKDDMNKYEQVRPHRVKVK